jgi:DNA-binding transcriptional LysR family regulator
LGIACLPYAAASEPVATGRLRILDTPFLNLRRRLSLVLHKSRYRGVLIDAFVASLESPPDSVMVSSTDTRPIKGSQP